MSDKKATPRSGRCAWCESTLSLTRTGKIPAHGFKVRVVNGQTTRMGGCPGKIYPRLEDSVAGVDAHLEQFRQERAMLRYTLSLGGGTDPSTLNEIRWKNQQIQHAEALRKQFGLAPWRRAARFVVESPVDLPRIEEAHDLVEGQVARVERDVDAPETNVFFLFRNATWVPLTLESVRDLPRPA